jgi:hypothetical protein
MQGNLHKTGLKGQPKIHPCKPGKRATRLDSALSIRVFCICIFHIQNRKPNWIKLW